MPRLRKRWVLAGGGALLLLGGGAFVRAYMAGAVVLIDPSNRIVRAEFRDHGGRRPLMRLPGGFYYGEPKGDGMIEVACRDGTGFGTYVTSAMPVWHHVYRAGPCAYP